MNILIAEPESVQGKRYRRMQTIELKPVQPVVPDSLTDKSDLPAEIDSLSTPKDSLNVTMPVDSLGKLNLTVPKPIAFTWLHEIEVRMPNTIFRIACIRMVLAGTTKESPYYYIDEVGYNLNRWIIWVLQGSNWFCLMPVDQNGGGCKQEPKSCDQKKGGFFQEADVLERRTRRRNLNRLTTEFTSTIDPHDSIFYTDSASIKSPKVTTPPKKGIMAYWNARRSLQTTPDQNKSPAKKEDGFESNRIRSGCQIDLPVGQAISKTNIHFSRSLRGDTEI